jgi:hypothetical protein
VAPQLEHHIINPGTGFEMAMRCAAVIRGSKKPLVVLLKSNSADAFGVGVPMPTFCVCADNVKKQIMHRKNKFFMLPEFFCC